MCPTYFRSLSQATASVRESAILWSWRTGIWETLPLRTWLSSVMSSTSGLLPSRIWKLRKPQLPALQQLWPPVDEKSLQRSYVRSLRHRACQKLEADLLRLLPRNLCRRGVAVERLEMCLALRAVQRILQDLVSSVALH
jgi:hypothetical protein